MTKLEKYAKAINQIDDYFEYVYKVNDVEEIRDRVINIIDDLAESLAEKE